MAALSDSFGHPPAAGADAGDYCSRLPCVIRTDDAHVAELVPRGADPKSSCVYFGSRFLDARRAVEDPC